MIDRRPANRPQIRSSLHRREKTRAAILKGAAEAFTEFGSHAVTVDDIIRAAGVSRATFYLYFENKHAVIETILRDTGDLVLEMFINLGVLTEATTEDLLKPLRVLIDFFADNPHLADIWRYASIDAVLARHMFRAGELASEALGLADPTKASESDEATMLSRLFFVQVSNFAYSTAPMPEPAREIVTRLIAELIARAYPTLLRDNPKLGRANATNGSRSAPVNKNAF